MMPGKNKLLLNRDTVIDALQNYFNDHIDSCSRFEVVGFSQHDNQNFEVTVIGYAETLQMIAKRNALRDKKP